MKVGIYSEPAAANIGGTEHLLAVLAERWRVITKSKSCIGDRG